ncbi:MAG: polymerase sigma-70 factor, subfamily [Deltaproteobacteria bacterium]|nr:polymerase sigma-70 factor, subfamily [Deltaproteobacteria bacterium]
MQVRALAAVVMRPEDSPPDPIAALVQEGKHREALASCARAHGRILGRLCMALLGSQADADEATQETLLRAHRAMPTYRGEGTIKAWLCGIARHVCAHTLETRRKGRELAELVPVPSEGEPREAFAHRQRSRAIRLALTNLKPSERDVLVLRFVADLSHREIAVACNLDEAAARKRISRALAHLRTVLLETPALASGSPFRPGEFE